jgi:hypothetical protein
VDPARAEFGGRIYTNANQKLMLKSVIIQDMKKIQLSEFYNFESELYVAYVFQQVAKEDLSSVSKEFNLILSTFAWDENP